MALEVKDCQDAIVVFLKENPGYVVRPAAADWDYQGWDDAFEGHTFICTARGVDLTAYVALDSTRVTEVVIKRGD